MPPKKTTPKKAPKKYEHDASEDAFPSLGGNTYAGQAGRQEVLQAISRSMAAKVDAFDELCVD